ncbi:MAG TPA: histidine phosphatase family protein [Rhizomicrobium sp.]|jgi:phosphohistidine phosphatase
MKKLLLLRHAKAVSHDEKHDKARALNSRGRSDSESMGRVMHREQYLPDLVFCSTARRTVETWEHLAPELKCNSEVRFFDELYDATATAIFACARRAESGARTVLMIGHNPGIHDCARMLARNPMDDEENGRVAALRGKFPTSALAVFGIEADAWENTAPAMGALLNFLTPRGLDAD